jgi:hypothetical protein
MFRPHPQAGTNGPRAAIVLAAFAWVCLFLVAAPAAQAATPNFQIKLPHKDAPTFQIRYLKITVSVTSAGPVNIKLTHQLEGANPDGSSHEFTNLQAGSAAVTNQGIGTDQVSIFPPAMGAVGPDARKYVIIVNLLSNMNPGTCVSLTNPADADETWQVEVTGAQFDMACVQSIDKREGVGTCGALRTVPLNDVDGQPPDKSVATIVGQGASIRGCRPGVDAVLVLDRSGSMGGLAKPGTADSTTKFTALKSAVTNFIDAWSTLRTLETTNPPGTIPNITSPADRVGVVFFDSSNPAQWLDQIQAGANITAGIDNFSANVASDIKTNSNLVPLAGATSIGSGLILAGSALAPCVTPANRKIIVVMSDGMENTAPTTKVAGNQVKTKAADSTESNLQCQPPTQLYALTVGSTTAIDPTINQAIATASGGFYLNSEYDGTVLTNFFTEVLQNFIKFSSVETYRMLSGTVDASKPPFTTQLRVTTSTSSLVFTLNWTRTNERLKLTVTPPVGGPIVRTVSGGDQPGSMILSVLLPSQGGATATGLWTIRVERDEVIVPGGGVVEPAEPAQTSLIPFNLIVLGDDASVNSDLTTVAADYAPGDQIRVSAKLTELGVPLTGLNSQPGAQVVARLVTPDQGGLGDQLSNSTATPAPPGAPDTLSPGDAKLQGLLNSGQTIQTATSDIQLLDNGNGANGDAVANDGIYSALFPGQLIGHYNFLIGAEGTSKESGRFSRQQLRTVHVRAVPDGGQTAASVVVNSGQLIVNLTPRTRFGNLLGPGWGNYFWVTAPGLTPVNFSDKLNGSYTATMNFTGDPPAEVQIHFERVTEHILDGTPPDKLPVPLGNGTVIKPNVPVPGGVGGFKRWGFSLHGGVSFPHSSNINSTHGPGPNFGADLEYRVNKSFSGELIYTYNRFRGDTANFGFGTFTFAPVNLHVLSLNGKVYGNSAPVRPFFNFGGGVYVFSPGATAHGGLNVGGGLQFDVTPNFAIDTMYNFHNVFVSGSNVQYSTAQGGLRWRF